MKNLHGIGLSILIGVFAIILSKFIPVGSVALAIIVGAIIGNTITINGRYNAGIGFSEKTLLAFAIALMGVNLDFVILSHLGIKSILLIIVSIAFTIYISIYLAKLFKFDKNFSLILGIGNGICGSAAIAATKDIVGLDKQKVGLSIAIVNFLGTIGIFLIPFIGHIFLNLNDIDLGIMIGNTLQAVGQVVASGFSVNESVGQSATIVKMGRILMLTPVILFLIYFFSKTTSTGNDTPTKVQIPMFIIGFIVFSILSTSGILPKFAIEGISTLSHYLLLVAMAAIGLKINFKTIKEHGTSALKIASLIFLAQILFTSLILILIF